MPSEITNKYKEKSEEIERIEKAIKCVLNKIGENKRMFEGVFVND